MAFRSLVFAALLTVLWVPPAGGQVAVPQRAAIDAARLLETVRTLASPAFEGRRTGTPGNARVRAWIVERYREIGLVPPGANFEMPFTFTPRAKGSSDSASGSAEGVNVVGTCRGSGQTASANTIVITAHYDHLGVRDGAIYHGADDNASGVAVLLALAAHCQRSPWTHDVIFAALDAEEQGLQGARAFVATPPIPRAHLALNVNLDMVSRSAKRELYIAGTHHRPVLKTLLGPVAARAPITVLFGHDKPTAISDDDWTTQSDHGAFHAVGIPFVYFGVEDHPDYHKPTDTADKIDPAFFAQVAATIRDAIDVLDRALPLR
jgi:Zn-dependent M28 family amino/carboxypeptidase